MFWANHEKNLSIFALTLINSLSVIFEILKNMPCTNIALKKLLKSPKAKNGPSDAVGVKFFGQTAKKHVQPFNAISNVHFDFVQRIKLSRISHKK